MAYLFIMHFVLCQAEATSRHEENLKQLIFVILCFNMHADYTKDIKTQLIEVSNTYSLLLLFFPNPFLGVGA